MSRLLRSILVAFLIFSGVSCSTDLNTPPHVLCRDLDGCPSNQELDDVLWTFHDRVASMFDPQDDLAVYWYPTDTVFWETEDSRVIGYTDSPWVVHVTSVSVLVHEVMHVHLWRTFPESGGDADHESGEGPWTEATNEAVREVIAALEGT